MAAKSHRALKITGIVIGVIVGIALIAVVALNIYMRVAFAPFFDRAESPFDIPGINTGFVPQDLDHVEADDSWLFSGYMADHSPSPIYRRATDGTITKFYVSLPDSTPIWPARRAISSSPWTTCCSPRTAPPCRPPRRWMSTSPPPS